MGSLFLVDLAYGDPQTHILACRTCHTHLALRRDFMMSYPRVHVEDRRIRPWFQFSKAVNLQVDGPERYNWCPEAYQVLADVRCVRCGKLLGQKVVRDIGWRLLYTPINRQGWYYLNTENLVNCKAGAYWNIILVPW